MITFRLLPFLAGAPARPSPRAPRPASAASAAGAVACAAALLLLAGCAADPASGYGPAFLRPASAAAQQAAAAAAGAAPAGAAAGGLGASAVDTAANHQALIRQMQGRGLWYASLAHADALELRWGVSDESRLLRADALLQTDQPDAAEPLYHALLASPMAPAAYRGLARIASARGQPQETVRMFEQARRRMPTDAALLSDLGYALLQAGQVDRARVPLMQAAQLQADAPDAAPRIFSNLAVYLLLAGRPDEARALAERRGMAPAVREAVAQQARALGRSAAPDRDAAAGGADAAFAAPDARAPAAPDAVPVPAPSAVETPSTPVPAPAPAPAASVAPPPAEGSGR